MTELNHVSNEAVKVKLNLLGMPMSVSAINAERNSVGLVSNEIFFLKARWILPHPSRPFSKSILYFGYTPKRFRLKEQFIR